jgi:hypothetical protein
MLAPIELNPVCEDVGEKVQNVLGSLSLLLFSTHRLVVTTEVPMRNAAGKDCELIEVILNLDGSDLRISSRKNRSRVHFPNRDRVMWKARFEARNKVIKDHARPNVVFERRLANSAAERPRPAPAVRLGTWLALIFCAIAACVVRDLQAHAGDCCEPNQHGREVASL